MSICSGAARIKAWTLSGQSTVTQIWSKHHSVMHSDGKRIGRQTALPRARISMMSIMFKITQNTIHHFSLAEILLMAAMNEIEAKRKPLFAPANTEGIS
ncbi:MAG: hypothetical protein WBV69_10800 [Candidatus Sulfotelmatobacter sp.]